jgi:hypothetical protein
MSATNSYRDLLLFLLPLHEMAADALVDDHGDVHREAVRRINEALAQPLPESNRSSFEAGVKWGREMFPEDRIDSWNGALEEAMAACRDEYLDDPVRGEAADKAYDEAISHCIGSIRALKKDVSDATHGDGSNG